MRRARSLAIAGLFLAPGAALAEPQYTADDILRYFGQSGGNVEQHHLPQGAGQGGDKPLVLPLTGARRGVTLGDAPSEGFDLMVTFEFGSDRLTDQARQNLDAFAQALRSPSLAGFGFEVQGHTDAVGSTSQNQVLSERRALSVVAYLVSRGVDEARLRARGYGESRPLMSDPRHPKNRRVETRRIR